MSNYYTAKETAKRHKNEESITLIVHGKKTTLGGYEAFAAKKAIRAGEVCPRCHNPVFPGDAMLYHEFCYPQPSKPKYSKAPIPEALRWQVWERDDFTCQNCGRRKRLSIDHIYPESKGGKTESSNLQTLCRRCNSKKGAR